MNDFSSQRLRLLFFVESHTPEVTFLASYSMSKVTNGWLGSHVSVIINALSVLITFGWGEVGGHESDESYVIKKLSLSNYILKSYCGYIEKVFVV